MTAPIQYIAVIVPARNERQLLPACLDALTVAAQGCGIPATTVVVLDSCTDDSVLCVAGRVGIQSISSSAGCVGQARASGVAHALRDLPHVPPERLWIASTDADSTVPPTWLAHHVALADTGADLVLGTVDLAEPNPVSPLLQIWRDAYLRRGSSSVHPHVHGANMGIRASTYLEVGGWPDQPAQEDVSLAAAVTDLRTAHVVATRDAPVATSARRVGRAPHGVAHDLRHIARSLKTGENAARLAS